MASFLDCCRFAPTLGGTTDWTYSSAVGGYQSPAAAGAVDGAIYRYRAESADLSQWEVGYGAYTVSGTVLARTTVLFNSSGTTSKISFSTVPQVAIVALAEDLVSQQIGQLPGEPSTGSASAGNVGEYLTASLASGSSLSLTTNTDTTIISKSLTAGDWDVSGVIAFSPGGSTVTTIILGGINTTTNAIPGADSGQQSGTSFGGGVTGGGTSYETTPTARISIASTTTVYLVAHANFTTSSMNVWGTIRCRRVR